MLTEAEIQKGLEILRNEMKKIEERKLARRIPKPITNPLTPDERYAKLEEQYTQTATGFRTFNRMKIAVMRGYKCERCGLDMEDVLEGRKVKGLYGGLRFAWGIKHFDGDRNNYDSNNVVFLCHRCLYAKNSKYPLLPPYPPRIPKPKKEPKPPLTEKQLEIRNKRRRQREARAEKRKYVTEFMQLLLHRARKGT
jgi:hypothetical protein